MCRKLCTIPKIRTLPMLARLPVLYNLPFLGSFCRWSWVLCLARFPWLFSPCVALCGYVWRSVCCRSGCLFALPACRGFLRVQVARVRSLAVAAFGRFLWSFGSFASFPALVLPFLRFMRSACLASVRFGCFRRSLCLRSVSGGRSFVSLEGSRRLSVGRFWAWFSLVAFGRSSGFGRGCALFAFRILGAVSRGRSSFFPAAFPRLHRVRLFVFSCFRLWWSVGCVFPFFRFRSFVPVSVSVWLVSLLPFVFCRSFF